MSCLLRGNQLLTRASLAFSIICRAPISSQGQEANTHNYLPCTMGTSVRYSTVVSMTAQPPMPVAVSYAPCYECSDRSPDSRACQRAPHSSAPYRCGMRWYMGCTSSTGSSVSRDLAFSAHPGETSIHKRCGRVALLPKTPPTRLQVRSQVKSTRCLNAVLILQAKVWAAVGALDAN